MQVIGETIRQIVRDMGADVDVVMTRPEAQFGDWSCNVALQLSKQLGRNPRDIAQEIADKLTTVSEVKTVTIAGPGFINITLTDDSLFALVHHVSEPAAGDSTIVIETNNPNPFKAMHIGHAMNAIVADTIANLLEQGNHLYRVSYHGDVGLHVGRSMYSLLRFVNGDVKKLSEVPAYERNSFMSRMYAEGSRAYKEDEAAKAEIDELSRQSFTRADPLYASVYDTVFAWSFDEIATNVARLGNKPVERKFLESDADLRGVKIVRDNVPRVFQESDGALIFKGSEHGSFDNVFVSKNGLGLYGARDIGLIQLKNEQYHPDKSYIVTADEQRDYFKGILAAAGMIWPELDGQTVNISTGMVKLTTGKMSSRSGDVIEIGWLFDQIGKAIHARGGEVTEDIVAGALRYAFLRVRIGGDVVFDVNESVSIQGNSGPYVQYAHARACSILSKAENQREEGRGKREEGLQTDERLLLRKITEYADVVEKATKELMPHHICNYLYELAQEFNRFYEKNHVIGDARQAIRLELVMFYRDTLARGLSLLGISAPEQM
ncbi:MAG: arginine--tRNA ligase [Candidatus Saccharimonadales bacterium]